MMLAFVAFWVLLFLGRDELGIRGIVLAIAIWAALLAGCILAGSPMLFMTAQALLDVGLLLIAFGGDIKIR